ncbi:hypothetical protein [Cognaticolwellia mytili]|uniref:hypothetical protein n=1 Tax=Cognaticolwellia mytili TaxID=1888913 RepID=UPI000A170A3F|nr:hypothetical protein [Cognaticolwellia mytili]
MYSKFLTVFALIFSFHSVAGISIKAVNNSDDELKIKYELESLQKTYDLSPWIITDSIEVDEKARTPRSHPVLTMSTQEEYLNSNTKLLSSFLHEQFHWHVIKNGRGSKSEFRAAIKAEFPNVQFERPFGSGTEGGTLSHIIVCYLEYTVLSELIGKESASKNISTNEYYTWVYQTILNPINHNKLDKLVQKFGLGFGGKNS